MARRMDLNEFVSFEEGLSSEKAALDAPGGDTTGLIPPGVYYVLSDTSVLLLSEKSCNSLQ
ncbi:MAG TPA: hypothetical protein VII64_01450 [Thermodesulfobacteriota bacterium]